MSYNLNAVAGCNVGSDGNSTFCTFSQRYVIERKINDKRNVMPVPDACETGHIVPSYKQRTFQSRSFIHRMTPACLPTLTVQIELFLITNDKWMLFRFE